MFGYVNELFTYGWRLWICIAFILLLFEGIDPGTLAPVFLAIGAFATAIFVYLHGYLYFAEDMYVGAQLLFFAAASLFSLYVIRPLLVPALLNQGDRDVNAETKGEGQMASIVSGFDSASNGIVMFQGTTWRARSINGEPLSQKEGRVKVVKIEGTEILVEETEDWG